MTSCCVEKGPLVSVVIPTLNKGGNLAKAIQSVVEQTYRSIEIVVVDDCSDNFVSLDVLPSCEIPLKIIRNEQRRGGGYSRNLGTLLSSGTYICFLDDDDQYLPNKIETLLAVMQKNTCDAVFGHVLKKMQGKHVSSENKKVATKKVYSPFFVPRLHTNGSLVRREVFGLVNFNPFLKKFQDTQFHIELINYCSVLYVDEDVACWNVNHSSEQVTAMDDPQKILKSIASFEEMISYFHKRRIGLLSRLFLMNNKCKMYAKYSSLTKKGSPYKAFNPLTIYYYFLIFAYKFKYKI